MKWLKWAAAVGAGIVGGILIQKIVTRQPLTPQQALQAVKHAAKQAYPIDGSWIHMTTETIEKKGIPYQIYRGGLTTSQESYIHHYDFIVDATTGTLLEISPST